MPDDQGQQQQGQQQQGQQQQVAAPWYQGVAGFDAEMVGHLTNRGWDKKTAPEAAYEALKSWREAEKFVGAPANELLRVPKDASDEAGWNNVWSRLGKPKEAKEYDFSAIKFADGTPLDDAFAETMRNTAFKLHLPKDAAVEITREFAKVLDSAETSEKAEAQAKLTEEKTALAKNWGQNFEANKFVAGRAAAALGVDPATVAALEGVVGYSKIMEMFRAIGARIGEDKFVTNTGAQSGGVMTRDQAVARKAELMADKAWVKSYLEKDAAKLREMTALNTIIVAQAA